MAGGRPRRGGRRIDAAIDYFQTMGYSPADVRAVVKDLLKVYGHDGWKFLEEGSYSVVLEALLEKQEQEDQRQLQLQQPEEEEKEDQLQQHEEEEEEQGGEEEEEPKQLEADNEVVPAEEENSMVIIDQPDVEPMLPLRPVKVTRTRPPCYGWISESDSESE